jgi:hypothetical protein
VREQEVLKAQSEKRGGGGGIGRFALGSKLISWFVSQTELLSTGFWTALVWCHDISARSAAARPTWRSTVASEPVISVKVRAQA